MNNSFFKTSLLLIWFSCLNLNAFSDENDILKYGLDDYGNLMVVGVVDLQYRGKIEVPYSVKGEKTGKTYYPWIIYKNAFSGCHMSEITLRYVERIGDYAFDFCHYLKKVSIGKSCKKIGEGVLCGTNEVTVNIDIENIYYDSRNGCNAIIETSTNKLIAGSRKTIIPEGIECLATHSFSNLSYLDSISIPKSVKEIEERAFINNFELRKVYVAATEPPTIYQDSFYNWHDSFSDNYKSPYENATLYVPKGCVEKYRNHHIWGQFKKIEEYDSTTSIHKTVINKNDDDRYFDMSGHTHETPIRGLNILKKKDGTTKKIIIKQR